MYGQLQVAPFPANLPHGGDDHRRADAKCLEDAPCVRERGYFGHGERALVNMQPDSGEPREDDLAIRVRARKCERRRSRDAREDRAVQRRGDKVDA